MKSNITILICLIVLTLSCANKTELTWQELYEQNWDDSYFITLDDVKDRNTLIVYSNIRDTEQEKDKKKLDELLSIYKDKLLNDNFDPLYSLVYIYNKYIDNTVKDNQELYSLLWKFNKLEQNNSIPSYILSYYFALKGDRDNTLKYLREGNRVNTDGLLQLLEIDSGQQKIVLNLFKELGTDLLRPIYDELDGKVSYNDLQILRLLAMNKEVLGKKE